MKLLMVGDVVGGPGRKIFAREVKKLKSSHAIDACIVNGENAAAGSGITSALAKELFDAGADAITLGDHTWGQKEFAGQIGGIENLVRPCNFAKECPGKGWTLVTMPTFRFAVVNVMGRTFMAPCDCPFKAMEEMLRAIPKDVPVFVDFHAEATSEKITFGRYFDGRVTAICGTHTHVQTSDAMVLPGGTAYLTDLGMCGPYVSSIGRKLEPVTKKFLTGMPGKFEVADGPATLEGAVITFDPGTKKATQIELCRIRDSE